MGREGLGREKRAVVFWFVSVSGAKGVGVLYVQHHPGTSVPEEGGVC